MPDEGRARIRELRTAEGDRRLGKRGGFPATDDEPLTGPSRLLVTHPEDVATPEPVRVTLREERVGREELRTALGEAHATRERLLSTSDEKVPRRGALVTTTDEELTARGGLHAVTDAEPIARRDVPITSGEELVARGDVHAFDDDEHVTRGGALASPAVKPVAPDGVLVMRPEEVVTRDDLLVSTVVDLAASAVLAFTAVAEMTTPDADLATTALLGTDRLARPLSNDERDALQRVLRANGFHDAYARAKAFATRLARGRTGADDLVQRACERLVRWGWDPARVTLAKRLCRMVWCEWTHEKRERALAYRAEEGFLQERAATAPAIHVRKNEGEFRTINVQPSVEDDALRLLEEKEEEIAAQKQLDALRARFRAKNDTVNLLWLDYTLEGVSDLKEMAHRSARDVEEFYEAARRRKRAVMGLAAKANGVTYDEGEDEP